MLGTLVALLYQPVYQRAVVFGLTRSQSSITNIHGAEVLKKIPDTAVCEDLHHHRPSNQIFAACQDDEAQHYEWFPPFGVFKNHKTLNTGSITVIDPEQFTSKKLRLKDFSGPFITHGIDVLSVPDDPTTVYIFAVNHLPNPLHYDAPSVEAASPNKARSQVELFRHEIGSDTADFVRSIIHPDIRTPNDIVATATDSFYVTNDHYYREKPLRDVEDLLVQKVAAWSDVVHVKINTLSSKDSEAGLEVSTAMSNIHNPNGIGHGHPDNPAEVVLIDCTGGVMHRTSRPLQPVSKPQLQRVDSFQLQSTLDNPSYYVDEYATRSNNASGYVLAGLARASDLGRFDQLDVPIPGMVWHLRSDSPPKNATIGGWAPHLIFQDEGYSLRTATTALIVGIDRKQNEGKKQGWLFVTGFLSSNVVAAKIHL